MRAWPSLRAAAAFGAAAALLAASGCWLDEDDEEVRVVAMAARALWPVSVGSDCEHWPLCQELPAGEVTDVALSNEDAVAVSDVAGTGFTLVGREPGRSRLTVRAVVPGEGEVERSVRVETFTPTDVWLVPLCSQTFVGDPIYLPPSTEVLFRYQLEADAVGDLPGYVPFEVGDLTEVEVDMVENLITWRTPGASGPIDIRSSALDVVIRTVEVYEESRIDGIDVAPMVDRPLEVGRSATIAAVPLIGADAVCVDDFTRSVELTTPEVCSLSADLEVTAATLEDATFQLHGRGPGLCSITVTLVETDVTATLELRVIEGE